MAFPDVSITTEHLLSASVTLLAFGFLLPSALRRDSTLHPMGKYMAIITGGAVTLCALAAVFALMGARTESATLLASSLIAFAIMAYVQSRFHLAVEASERTAKAIADAIGEAISESIRTAKEAKSLSTQGDSNKL